MAARLPPISIPPLYSLDDARQAFALALQGLQTSLSIPSTTFDGSRLTNVGSPQAAGDVVTLGYLRALLPSYFNTQPANQNTTINSGTGVPQPTAGLNIMTVVSGTVTPLIADFYTNQITLAGGVTVAPPVGGGPGQTFAVQLIQDGSGGHPVIWNGFYIGISGFTLSTPPSTYATLVFQINLAGTGALLLDVAMNGNPL